MTVGDHLWVHPCSSRSTDGLPLQHSQERRDIRWHQMTNERRDTRTQPTSILPGLSGNHPICRHWGSGSSPRDRHSEDMSGPTPDVNISPKTQSLGPLRGNELISTFPRPPLKSWLGRKLLPRNESGQQAIKWTRAGMSGEGVAMVGSWPQQWNTAIRKRWCYLDKTETSFPAFAHEAFFWPQSFLRCHPRPLTGPPSL